MIITRDYTCDYLTRLRAYLPPGSTLVHARGVLKILLLNGFEHASIEEIPPERWHQLVRLILPH